MKNLKESNNQKQSYIINKVKVLSVVGFTAFAVLMACSKDDVLKAAGINCGSLNWAEEFQSELTNWSNAAANYSENPTTANCNSYKSAGQKYLSALEDLKKCVPTANSSEFNQSIQEAKDELNKLDCP